MVRACVCHILSKFHILGKLNVLYESTARRDMQPLQDHVDVPVQLLILKRLCGLILLLEDSAKGVKKVNLHFPLYLTCTWWTPRIRGHNAKDEKNQRRFLLPPISRVLGAGRSSWLAGRRHGLIARRVARVVCHNHI